MNPRLRVTVRGVVLSLTLLGAALLACVGGHIPPSTFQFHNVVRYSGDGKEAGGCKVAQVLILLSRISPVFSSTATCDIEVGVPERNRNGWVLDEFAQLESAKAADKAARIVLKEKIPTGLACVQFRMEMQRILTDKNTGAIPGTQVTAFQWNVPRSTFP
ncbi:MAG TPA: hypothetical protein VEU33_07225 [Archangium sp.]|nr:hypothetical protein [Archangium sp.]